MKTKNPPHKHAEFIHAFAEGFVIEYFDPCYSHLGWQLDYSPRWYEHCQYRNYDPIREVKVAFAEGIAIQYSQKEVKLDWIDFKDDGSILPFNLNYHWRIKPNQQLEPFKKYPLTPKDCYKFKIGDLVKEIKSNNVYRIVKEEKDVDRFHLELSYIEYNSSFFKKATKEEVLNAPNYNGSATNKDFPFKIGDIVNSQEIKGETEILKDSADIIKAIQYEYTYAIREIPKEYIPFTWEDREMLRDRWVKHKKYNTEFLITGFEKNNTPYCMAGRILTFQELFNDFIFLDGSPCGKLKHAF